MLFLGIGGRRTDGCQFRIARSVFPIASDTSLAPPSGLFWQIIGFYLSGPPIRRDYRIVAKGRNWERPRDVNLKEGKVAMQTRFKVLVGVVCVLGLMAACPGVANASLDPPLRIL